jgi:DNA polymerase (family 10)
VARGAVAVSTDRLSVASVLEQIAAFLEFRGENQFRVRAFRNAAKAMLGLPASAAAALADGSLPEVRGIGPASLAIVKELVETGRSAYLEQLKQESPAGLLDLLDIPGLGAARVRMLHEKLGIDSLAALEAAARDGRLATLPGLGAKTAEKILKGIAFARGTRSFRLWHHAAAEAEVLRSSLERLTGVTRVLVAGEVRRRCEVVSELALAAAAECAPAELHQALARLPGIVAGVAADGLLSFRSPPPLGMAASVRVAPPAGFGAALARATGSDSHWEQLVAHAMARGLMLESSALHRAKEALSVPDEAALYQALGLADMPPELREGGDEVALAAEGKLPRLIEPADLLGFLHCHTTYSDGSLGVEEMATAVRDAGYSYLGITDHSKSAGYAGGLSVEDLRRQWKEIDGLNARLSGIRILKGIESDILLDGGLDYDVAILADFDFVIGSIHSRFSLGEIEMTARVLRALDHPYLTILGHPTGRLLLSRNPYALDLPQVFARAAANGVALEINGDPHRLDLDWRMARRAREQGVTIALGADAHGRSGIGNLEFATAMARKAGLTKPEVLNTRSVAEFLKFARARRP